MMAMAISRLLIKITNLSFLLSSEVFLLNNILCIINVSKGIPVKIDSAPIIRKTTPAIIASCSNIIY